MNINKFIILSILNIYRIISVQSPDGLKISNNIISTLRYRKISTRLYSIYIAKETTHKMQQDALGKSDFYLNRQKSYGRMLAQGVHRYYARLTVGQTWRPNKSAVIHLHFTVTCGQPWILIMQQLGKADYDMKPLYHSKLCNWQRMSTMSMA